MQENEIPNPYIFNGDVVLSFLIPTIVGARILIPRQPGEKPFKKEIF